MSTPGDQLPLFGDIPQNHLESPIPAVDPPANQILDLADSQQKVTDLSQTFHEQLAAAYSVLDSMTNRMGTLADTVKTIPEAFASTADHIQRSVAATNELANASRKVSDTQRTGATSPGGAIRMNVLGRTIGSRGNQSDPNGNNEFHIKDLLHDVVTGNIQGALGEVFQGIDLHKGSKSLSDLGQQLRERGEAMRGGGFRMRGSAYTGMANEEIDAAAGGTSLLGRLAGLGLGGAGAAMGGAGALLGSPIMGMLASPAFIYGAFHTAMNDQRRALEIGRLTGEGRGAGFAATGFTLPFLGSFGGEVGSLRGSPFDLVGQKEAMQIVEGIRGAGFRGGQASATEQAVANIVNQLGVDVPQALKITITAIKDANMSTGQLTTQMDSLAKVAHDSGAGIQSLTQAVGDLLQNLASQSRQAAAQATPQLTELMRTFQGTEVGRHPEAFGGLLQEGPGRQALALLSGFAPFQDFTSAFTQNFNTEFNRMLVSLAAGNFDSGGRQQMDWNAYVRIIMLNPLYQQLFTSFSVPQIVDLLSTAARQSNKGRNPNRFIQREANRNAANNASMNAAGVARRISDVFGKNAHQLLSRGGRPIPGYSGGVDQNLVRRQGMKAEQEIAHTIANLGLSNNERQAILNPIIKAAQAGDRHGVEKALREAAKTITTDQKAGDVKVNVQVGFDPTSSRMLKSWNSAKISALRGQGGTQGAHIHSEP